MQFDISKSFSLEGSITENVSAVMRMFGISVERLTQDKIVHRCQLKIQKGDVVYFSGPSGAGKTVLFNELEKMIPANEKINLDKIPLAKNKAVIDCLEGDILSRLKSLSIAGLNDVFCILNSPAVLSEGQQWRFCLAKGIGQNKAFIFADEFCSNLDAVTASVVSYNLRKFANKKKQTFVLAGSRTDFLPDLEPDVLVQKDFSGCARVIYKDYKR